MVILVGVALFASAFFGRFLAAICRERRHVKICMLLRQQPEGSSVPIRSGDKRKRPATGAAAPVIAMPSTGRAEISQVWSKVG